MAGGYSVSYTESMTAVGINWMRMAIYKNGALFAQDGYYWPTNPYTITSTFPSIIISMNGVSDYIEFFVSQSDASAHSTLGSTYTFASILKVY